MTRLMIVVGSVRPGRAGLPVAEWVREQAVAHGGFEIDFVDLAELALPLMDEPEHPRLARYTRPHTIAWSSRVAAAEAFIFVTPEYNHSYAPALKNALDYLNREWWRKPVGFVSYGGVSGGTRGVAALTVPVAGLGLVKTGANVEIPFIAPRVAAGVFEGNEKELTVLTRLLDELGPLSAALAPARAAG